MTVLAIKLLCGKLLQYCYSKPLILTVAEKENLNRVTVIDTKQFHSNVASGIQNDHLISLI